MIKMMHLVRPRAVAFRTFSTSPVMYKKKAAKATSSPVASEAEQPVKQLDLDALKQQLENTKSLFADKLKEIKAGSLDQKKFQTLPVELGSTETPLGQLATIAIRGNKLSIVAYDPKHVKHIRTAIIGKLGVPAEESKTDSQTLSVNLTSNSANQKAEQAKQLKTEYQHFKGSASRHSIASVRTKFLSTVKKSKTGKSQQDQKQETKQVEDMVKSYQSILDDMLRKAST